MEGGLHPRVLVQVAVDVDLLLLVLAPVEGVDDVPEGDRGEADGGGCGLEHPPVVVGGLLAPLPPLVPGLGAGVLWWYGKGW